MTFVRLVCFAALALVAAACGGANNPDAMNTPSAVAPGQPPIEAGAGPGARPEGAVQPGNTLNSPASNGGADGGETSPAPTPQPAPPKGPGGN